MNSRSLYQSGCYDYIAIEPHRQYKSGPLQGHLGVFCSHGEMMKSFRRCKYALLCTYCIDNLFFISWGVEGAESLQNPIHSMSAVAIRKVSSRRTLADLGGYLFCSGAPMSGWNLLKRPTVRSNRYWGRHGLTSSGKIVPKHCAHVPGVSLTQFAKIK